MPSSSAGAPHTQGNSKLLVNCCNFYKNLTDEFVFKAHLLNLCKKKSIMGIAYYYSISFFNDWQNIMVNVSAELDLHKIKTHCHSKRSPHPLSFACLSVKYLG